MKILILGGYGRFGGRLVELLSDIPEIECLICGRDRGRAEAFCAQYRGQGTVRPLRLDRADIETALRAEKPDLVVDASGPFQDYGTDPYRVISACIEAGIDYLDFADGADFVFGVSQFDDRAKAAGVFVISGVSSCPALTAAVLRELAGTMQITAIKGGIAPSPHAVLGLNVMRAVLGYAGAPVTVLRDGKPFQAVGLGESLRYTIAPPGKMPLRNIHFSLVDVPDLQVIPPEYPSLTDLWIGAGPVPEFLHRLLNLLAKARARFHLPSLEPLSKLFYRVLKQCQFGEHRGGMFIHARGLAGGVTIERSWHLLAEGDDGPYIPSMASEVIIRKLVAGLRPPPGARSAIDALELGEFDDLFRKRKIFTGFREDAVTMPLYRTILGSSFATLPPRLQELHGNKIARQWSGFGEVIRGKGLLASLVASIVGFPKAAKNVPVTVTFMPENGAERWTRRFGKKSFSSVHSLGTGRNEHLLVERFGLASFALALVIEGESLFMVPRRWSVLGIPMPRFLLPGGETFETEKDGQFCFHVEIAMPLIGLIVAYKGRLDPNIAKEG